MKTKIILLLISIALVSCNTKASADKKIKQTVTSFLDAVERDKPLECTRLIHNGGDYYGGIHMDVSFLHKHYKKINSIVDLKKNIKIKDTIYVGAKMKYVQYHIKDNSKKQLKPLIITFIFYKHVGYDKIFNSSFLDNSMLDWN